MNQFRKLPRWLRILLPAVFVSLCIAINAVAFTEIAESLQARREANSTAANPTTTSTAAHNTEASRGEVLNITPVINPDATLDKAVKQARSKQAGAEKAKSTTAIETQSTTSATSSTATPSAATSVETQSAEVQSAATTGEASTPKYGHFPYAPASPEEMVLIASYSEGNAQRQETLHPEAAAALLEMVAAARSDGIWLVPASGFRTVAQQQTLFDAQIAAKGSPEAAASVSAPPGYSEHHTGYAVDLTDGSLPQADDISVAFADSPAYQWLLSNAARFDFELTFPEGNEQGISYEPWHWRYVGSPAARALFKGAPDSAAVDSGSANSGAANLESASSESANSAPATE